jgi:hypothetical protein
MPTETIALVRQIFAGSSAVRESVSGNLDCEPCGKRLCQRNCTRSTSWVPPTLLEEVHLVAAHYSQRKTFAESAIQTTNATDNATISPMCANHESPFQIPSSNETA